MAKPTDTREKLLQVAFDLIWNQSYGSVSVDQICERAHVNKGSFYHFFESKSELAVEAYEENWREKQPELDRVFSAQNPPLERLLGWCQYVRDRQRKKAEKYGHVCGCPYASLGTELATQDEKIRGKSQEIMDRTIRYIESALRDAAREGLISLEDAGGGARRIYTAVLGQLLYAKVHNDLGVLSELEPMIMNTIGVRALAA
ncbi:MAG TPA: TetR/AcrR family transcriptional regulator [Verrucomicrobiae bacterium]|jgi:TetR/AcrR family transcriptional repressor of nem operon|nr:TetR/AcrR family transcriptional regulator [Verrucomicrobiae bacterium]